jgi:hypothetical protein
VIAKAIVEASSVSKLSCNQSRMNFQCRGEPANVVLIEERRLPCDKCVYHPLRHTELCCSFIGDAFFFRHAVPNACPVAFQFRIQHNGGQPMPTVYVLQFVPKHEPEIVDAVEARRDRWHAHHRRHGHRYGAISLGMPLRAPSPLHVCAHHASVPWRSALKRFVVIHDHRSSVSTGHMSISSGRYDDPRTMLQPRIHRFGQWAHHPCDVLPKFDDRPSLMG